MPPRATGVSALRTVMAPTFFRMRNHSQETEGRFPAGPGEDPSFVPDCMEPPLAAIIGAQESSQRTGPK